MNWDEDDYIVPETEQERLERERDEREARVAKQIRQLGCLHTHLVETGAGVEIMTDGKVRHYASVICRDCDCAFEIERAL